MPVSFPPRKALGQHFLHDPAILDRAALAAGPVAGRAVIEVGPGPGGLTAALLRAGADPVIAIETDTRFAEALARWPEASTRRLQVVAADATSVNWAALLRSYHVGDAMIVANLPYHIATRLLIDWLQAGDWRQDMALMFQKEVALRVCAPPNCTAYGRLSVMTRAVMSPHIAFSLPAGAFRPRPKIASAMVSFSPLPPNDRFENWRALETVVAASFATRRKMLRNGLQALFRPLRHSPADILHSLGIDPARRAETLDQDEFRALARAFAAIADGTDC